ncbi:MAG TPA: polysaccharide biosynthesis tyrosine autokinase [Caulobacteraceae bacterium]|nr:polysaccharide biosynthesis tyrosine autokinase [Caulobacteraceae bacterium]
MTQLLGNFGQLPAVGGEAYLPAPTRAGDSSRVRELLGVILQRLWPALAIGIAVSSLVMIAVALTPPTYVATGALMIEPSRENLAKTTEPSDTGLPPDTSAIDTQVEVLKSPALAQAVSERLKLYQDPEFNPAIRHDSPAARALAGPNSDVIAAVQKHLRIKRAGLTYVVDVGFASHSPTKAELVANTYMAAFLRRELDEKIAQVNRANAELGGQVERLRASAEQAEAGVQQYKIAHKLYSAEGATIAEQEVSTLNQQVAQAKADAAEKQARLAAAVGQVARGSGGADVTAAVTSDTVRDLRKEEAETSQKLAQLQAIFQKDYPEVQKTQAELNDIRAEIQAQLNRIMSSVRAEASASSQREGSLLSSRGSAQAGLVSNNRAQVGLVALQQRADAAQKIYDAYLARADQVASEGSLQQPDAVVSSQALRPLRPTSPNLKVGALLALILGAMSAAAAIVLAELWDRKLRSRGDIEQLLRLPLAAVIPSLSVRTLRGGEGGGQIAKSIIDNRHSAFAESFRNVRAFLKFSEHDAGVKTLAVTSALPREGKTVTSLCLGRSLALSGARVLVIDCDLRKRGLSRLTGHQSGGLVEVIEGKLKADEAMIHDRSSGAWILPTSPTGPLPHELFSDPRTDALLKELEPHFDHVILELPPVLGLADARILAAKADRVLYVVRWNKTPARAAQAGLDVLRELGANVVGAALTQVNIKQQSRYGYCDGTDYFNYFRNYYLPPTRVGAGQA